MDTIRLRTTQAPTAVKDPATPLNEQSALPMLSSGLAFRSFNSSQRVFEFTVANKARWSRRLAAPQCHHRNNRTQSDHHQTWVDFEWLVGRPDYRNLSGFIAIPNDVSVVSSPEDCRSSLFSKDSRDSRQVLAHPMGCCVGVSSTDHPSPQ